MTKRKIFDELIEGVDAMKKHRERKLTLRSYKEEVWEQGRAKPNPQAAALVLLVRRYPDTLERLEKVAAG